MSANLHLTMAVEEIDAMSLMPLETPVLKVSRPVAVSPRGARAEEGR